MAMCVACCLSAVRGVDCLAPTVQTRETADDAESVVLRLTNVEASVTDEFSFVVFLLLLFLLLFDPAATHESSMVETLSF
jgi:hypothetical protein